MKYVTGHPTIKQLKRWCENQSPVTFKHRHKKPVFYSTILEVRPALNFNEEDYNVEIKIRVNYNHIQYTVPHDNEYEVTYKLQDIISYVVPKKIEPVLFKSFNLSKDDVILQWGNSSWRVNKKVITAESKFFRKLIKNKKKELSSWKFFTCIPENKRPLLINLDHLFDSKHKLKLLLRLLDEDDLDDFIHTPQDALLLFELINQYPLQKNKAGIRYLENQIKNRFFELIGDGLQLVKADKLDTKYDKLDTKTKFFLNNLESELIDYCTRKNTQPCRNLLSYCFQIEKYNKLLILDASRDAAYLTALRLLIFCNFKIFTLVTVAITPELFKNIDLSSLPLHTLKMYPSAKRSDFSFYYSEEIKLLFRMITNSKTLKIVQIGNPPNPESLRASYLEESLHPGFCFKPETVEEFNSLKPILNARLRSFYEKTVVPRFFNKYLPQQQSRFLSSFLTVDDLENLRLAANQLYPEIKKLKHAP